MPTFMRKQENFQKFFITAKVFDVLAIATTVFLTTAEKNPEERNHIYKALHTSRRLRRRNINKEAWGSYNTGPL